MKSEDDEPSPFRCRPKRKDPHIGKISFPSEKSAQSAADRLISKGRGYARVYECGTHFHITSKLPIKDALEAA